MGLSHTHPDVSYDHLDRITAFTDTGAANERDFAYDNFGNMALKGWKGDMTPSGGSVVLSSSYPGVSNIYNQSTNRLNDGTRYDSAGNVRDLRGTCSSCLQYDAANRLVTSSATNTSYSYDGEDHRVVKSNGPTAATVNYVYDALDHLAAEYASSSTTPVCTICCISSDHLGTTRMVTDQNGNLVSRHDYLPFGEEILSGFAEGRMRESGAHLTRLTKDLLGKNGIVSPGLITLGPDTTGRRSEVSRVQTGAPSLSLSPTPSLAILNR